MCLQSFPWPADGDGNAGSVAEGYGSACVLMCRCHWSCPCSWSLEFFTLLCKYSLTLCGEDVKVLYPFQSLSSTPTEFVEVVCEINFYLGRSYN